MSRPKRVFHADLRGRIDRKGRSIVLPVESREDPGRTVEVLVPRSRIESFLDTVMEQAIRIDRDDASYD